MWKFVCLCLSFTALLASADKRSSLEKSSSSSDEVVEDFPSWHGKKLHFREEGVNKVEECLQIGKFDRKVCDSDDLLNDAEEELIKASLRELETLTSQPMHPDQFQRGGVKLTILLMKDVKDIKETDERIYEIVKKHAEEKPFDRVGVIVLSVGGSSDFRGHQTMISRSYLSNIPIYAYSAGSGVWANFYSTSTLNTVLHPSEIIRLYNNESPMLREGTFAVALLDIIHGIRDRALIKQSKMYTERTLTQAQSLLRWPQQQPKSLDFLQFRIPRQMQTINDEIYKVERCLEHFEAKVCDPDDMLNAEEQLRVDSALVDLESSTVGVGNQNQQQWISRLSSNCKQGGIKLATIVIKSVQDQQGVDRKINEMLYKESLLHPCDRSAVMMLSPGPDYRNRLNLVQQQMPLNYITQFPVGVWSKFYGISNINVPVASSEIVQFYDTQKPLIRQGKYGDALVNIINEFKLRVLGGRVTRQTEFEMTGGNFDNFERHGTKKSFKKLTMEEEERIFEKLDKCLQSIKPKVCDLEQILTNNERDVIEDALEVLEKDSSSHPTDLSTQNGFVLTVVVMPFTNDITEYEKKIAERLSQWREAHPNEEAAVMMLSAERDEGGLYDRSKFYGTSTRNSVVRPHEFVKFYNNTKFLIRTGKHGEAILSIIKKIHERTLTRQQGTGGIF